MTEICRQTSGSRTPTGLQFSPDIISEEMKAKLIKIHEIDCQAAFNIKTYSQGMFWSEILLPILTDDSVLISVWLVVLATSENRNKSATSLAVICHHVCCAEGPQKLPDPLILIRAFFAWSWWVPYPKRSIWNSVGLYPVVREVSSFARVTYVRCS